MSDDREPTRYRVVDRRKRMRPDDEPFRHAIEQQPYSIESKHGRNPFVEYSPKWLPIPGAWYVTRAEAQAAVAKLKGST